MFDEHLRLAQHREQRHDGVGGLTDEVHVGRGGGVDLEASEQGALREEMRSVAQESIVIAQKSHVQAAASTPHYPSILVLNNYLKVYINIHIHNKHK